VEPTARQRLRHDNPHAGQLIGMGISTTDLDTIEQTPRIGSEIRVDLDTLLSGDAAGGIRSTLEERGVVFFRGLQINDEQQIAIATTLGNIVANEGENGIYKISLDTNVNPRADYLRGSMFWHFDGSLQPHPNLATLLRAMRLSDSGGQTEFCNTYAAYDDLPQTEKIAIAELQVVHSAERSQYYVRPEMSHEEIAFWQKSATKTCPIVWTHRSGRKSLLLGASADYVKGLPVEESRALLARLRDWATQPQYVYQHQWELGDLVIWDNTGTMHRALPYADDSGRLMHRTILAGEEPLQ
jgi:alpha-ketoglutarate-dependent taurine dioxygenase